ncbi:MAG TPA: EAL domain-containing protein [Solirubrobacteraceae bacterium]|nr:EAL domain-containing protein [Solirubrobacteraceae bacterium]
MSNSESPQPSPEQDGANAPDASDDAQGRRAGHPQGAAPQPDATDAAPQPDAGSAAPEPDTIGEPPQPVSSAAPQPDAIGETPEADGSGEAQSTALPASAMRAKSGGGGAGRATWILAAAVCVAAGVSASVLGAHSVATKNATKAEQAFHASAAGVASTLKLSIQHEEDLVENASTFFASNPLASQTEFATWSQWVRTLRRYPELERMGLVTVVPASELAAFQARVVGKVPAAPVAGGGSSAPATGSAHAGGSVGLLRITPPGGRPYYCLASAEIVRSPARRARLGLDYCARMPTLLLSRDSGTASYAPVSATRAGQLNVDTPIFRGSAPASGPAGRTGSFVGWLREVLVPGVVLEEALRGHPGVAVRLSYKRGTSNATFALGTPQTGAPSATTSLHEGWTVESFGAPVSSDVLSDPEARGLLIAGCLLSLLLGVLIYVLGSGRPGGAAPRRPGAPRGQRSPGDGLYDELTGVPGRALTLDRAERTVARAGRQSGMLAGALLIDVDWFSDVNERFGRAAGDQLLQIVAERLDEVVRTEDSLGRMEGDRFAIIVESVARGVRLDSLARRVIEALHEPIGIDDFGPSFHLTASIGVAYGRYTSHEQMLHDAELALRASKTAGKDRYTLFNANMRAVIEDRGVLEAELNAALRESQFFMLYQPICDLRTRKVIGLEAMIRWQHPKQGVLLPSDFIPLAEETGLIVPIGRWALQEACGRAAAWEVAGHRVAVGVQVSANQFNRDGFATDVLRALQQSGVEPSLVTLELDETTIMSDAAVATERMHELKGLGVQIAIDNFGSGYAYRSDLQRMPIDYLKVDRGSLAASEDEDYRHWLLEAILVFGRDLSLTVVAKGIETAEQVDALQTMGCTLAQGHFFGEPAPGDALERLFAGGVSTVRATSTGMND